MRRSRPFYVECAALAVIAAASLHAPAALAQTPVVQAVPGGDGMRLNAALARLARNPRDVEALIDAGVASLAAGDSDAAVGFYQKADGISPANARIKSGLASAFVLGGDPASAIPLFDEAERLGPIDAVRLSDRGLAYDMVGDAATAQRYYHEALMAGPNDETSRRLALSQAIAGDRRGMEVTLGPLLQRQDKAAWRTRAFALAVLNQVEEADSIAKSTMPPDLAAAIGNYLRYMPKLTPAQQAAAGNLGRFPRAAEIGRDDPRFALLVRTRPVPVATAAQPVKLASKDERKRAKTAPPPAIVVPPPASPVIAGPTQSLSKPAVTQPVVAAAAAPALTTPVRVANSVESVPVKPAGAELAPLKPATVAVSPAPLPALSTTVPSAQVTAKPVAVQPAVVEAKPAPPSVTTAANTAPATVAKPPQSEPGFATLDNPSATFALKPATPAPATTPAPVQPVAKPVGKPAAPAAKPRSLAEVFADLTPPSREAEPSSGAVDLRKLKAPAPAAKTAEAEAKLAKDAAKTCAAYDPETGKLAKGAKVKLTVRDIAMCKDLADKAAKAEKAKTPANPSRIWVQVATGRDRKGLAFDWRRFAKDDPALFKGRKAFVTASGQSNRLLTGPFETAAQANAFVTQLKKADLGGAFVWNSPAGQVVDTLPGT